MFVTKPEQLVGKQLGNYRLKKFIKGGGFGLVYKAEHVRLQKIVAVKLLRPEHVLNEKHIASFEREAQTIARFTHPHILDVYDYDVLEGIPFIVMPFIEQGSLRTLHPPNSILEMATVVSYVKQIANALQYAHNHKVVHRDIKPDNFLQGPQGVLLSDFGIAVTAHSIDSLSTQDGNGTLFYMAPEQFEHRAQARSDQYSFAVVVYEWLCGKLPFYGENFFEMYHKHKYEDPPLFQLPLVQLQVDIYIPQVIEEVVRKGLAKDPQQRFENIQTFADALEQAYKSVGTARAAPYLSIYDNPRDPDDLSDLAVHPHEKIFPAGQERNNLRFGWHIIGASRRGYGHAYEGKYREDDFWIKIYGSTHAKFGHHPDLVIAAIADGVSSKILSRRGARAAVLGATQVPEHLLDRLRSLLGKNARWQECMEETYSVLMHALQLARTGVEDCAYRSQVTIDELQSTLLVFLAAPWDQNHLLVASAQIGDGALFVLQQKKEDRELPYR